MSIERYYKERAAEYEQIYHRPDPTRQAEQLKLANDVKSAMRGNNVLEVACGTGYWTQFAAETAKHIVATDLSEETLAIARSKNLPPDVVEFRQADAFALTRDRDLFNAGLSMFWLSHVPRARLTKFLDGFHAALGTGSTVLIADNVLVEGIGGQLVKKPGEADTYKARTLENGTTYEILKNYFEEAELRRIFSQVRDLRIELHSCFWWVQYKV